MKFIIPATVFTLFGLCAGCTLDNPAEGPQTAPLNLQVQQNLSLVNFTWPKVNVTGFAEYILLQSNTNIPDAPEPVINQNVAVMTRIDDVDVTSFSAVNTLFAPQVCYKLYTKVNDRFLYSPTVCINSQADLIGGFYDRVGYDKTNHDLVMFDRSNRFLSIYDLDNSVISANVPENNMSFPVVAVSTHQGITAAYMFDQNQGNIRKFNMPELGQVIQKQVFDGLAGGLVAGPWIFVGTQNASSSFQVWDANSFVVRDTRQGFTGLRHYASFPGDTTIVLELWDTGMRRYTINGGGKVITQNEFSTGVIQVSTQNASDVNDQYYIGGRFSTIVDKDANIISSLNEDVNTFAFFNRFSEDGTRVVALVQDQASFFLDIYDISNVASPLLIKRYALPLATYAELAVKHDIIYIVGIDFSSSVSQSFILKIPVVS